MLQSPPPATFSTSPFHCSGPLPLLLAPITSKFVVSLVGCTAVVRTGDESGATIVAHLLLGIDALNRSVCTIHPPAHLRCENAAFGRHWQLRVAVNGVACDPLTRLTHVSRTRCIVVNSSIHDPMSAATLTIGLISGGVEAASAANPVRVPLVRAPTLSRFATCTATALYGGRKEKDGKTSKPAPSGFVLTRSAWRGLHFNSSIAFARSESGCDALRDATPYGRESVACEARAYWRFTPRLEQRTPYFDQGVHIALCLLYAQAANVELLALTDFDEEPPPDLWTALRRVIDQSPSDGMEVGLRIFFDADGTCPIKAAGVVEHEGRAPSSSAAADGGSSSSSAPSSWWCPCSEEAFHRHCRAPHGRVGQRRVHWKLILVPSRARDASVHWASGWGRRRQRPHTHAVWCPCLRHAHAERRFGLLQGGGPQRGRRRRARGAHVIPLGWGSR